MKQKYWKLCLNWIMVLTLVLCVPCAGIAEELTAKQIMEKADERYTGDSSISENLMVLIDRRGKKRIRHIKNFRKDYGKDTKSVSFFLSPADVKNTAFFVL